MTRELSSFGQIEANLIELWGTKETIMVPSDEDYYPEILSQDDILVSMSNKLSSGNQRLKVLVGPNLGYCEFSHYESENNHNIATYNSDYGVETLDYPVSYSSLSKPTVKVMKNYMETGGCPPGLEAWISSDPEVEKMCYRVGINTLAPMLASCDKYVIVSYHFDGKWNRPKCMAMIKIEVCEEKLKITERKSSTDEEEIEKMVQHLNKLSYEMPIFANDPAQLIQKLKSARVGKPLLGFSPLLPIGIWDGSSAIKGNEGLKEIDKQSLTCAESLFILFVSLAKITMVRHYSTWKFCKDHLAQVKKTREYAVYLTEFLCMSEYLSDLRVREKVWRHIIKLAGTEGDNPYNKVRVQLQKSLNNVFGHNGELVTRYKPNCGVPSGKGSEEMTLKALRRWDEVKVNTEFSQDYESEETESPEMFVFNKRTRRWEPEFYNKKL